MSPTPTLGHTPRSEITSDLVDAHDLRLDDALVTAVLLAGEELAAPMRPSDRMGRRASPATPLGRPAPLATDFGWMLDVVRHAAVRLAEQPARSRLADAVTEALGDGEALAQLFGRFFPRTRAAMRLGEDGRPILTRRQIELLREAGLGLSHRQIAERLGISLRTVTTHMNHIHRRLCVNKTVQALAQAAALGYLDVDAVGFVRGAGRRDLRDVSTLHALLAAADNAETVPGGRSLRRLGQFGVLLTLASVAATMAMRSDIVADLPLVGVVCRLSPSGELAHAFGSERLRSARGICVAPAVAANEGFTPGNIYVINDALPQRGLNAAEIVEYTPHGVEVRGFCGGEEIGTRLVEARSLAFDAQGRLLATSGTLTDAVLAFTRGGSQVARFASVRCAQLAPLPGGGVCAATTGPGGGSVVMLDAEGVQIAEIARQDDGSAYSGIGILSSGRIITNRLDCGRGHLEVLTEAGDCTSLLRLPAARLASIHVDQRGRVLAPCALDARVRVFRFDGLLLQSIALEGIVTPDAVTVSDDGSIWVSGQVE